MKQISGEIVTKAGQYATDILQNSLPARYVFHTLDHTEYVVKSAEAIGIKSGLNTDELNLIKVCAWFHDLGYSIQQENHEEESAKLLITFLKSKNVDDETIEHARQIIMATKMPQQPTDNLARILCDADLHHLADDKYFELSDNLRKEWANCSTEKVGKRRFYKMSVDFMKKHKYHTDYGIKILQPRKEENLHSVEKEIFKLEQEKEKKMLETEKKKTKAKGYSRGVESMFRLTARNQISLSSIADNKSNILITVNALMMSITMTVLVTRFEELPNIILPTIIFLMVSLVTIVLAILSTRPNISSGKFSKEDIKQNKVNLLFFGNFYNMKLDEYEWAIGELMRNDENLYGTMIKDQYFLGKVLAKKYKLLRVAYTVFMFGIVISVLSFVLAFTNF